MTAEKAFDDHHKSVYRFVYRFLGRADLAEDVTQDCFLCLLRDPGRWNAERGDLRTYLFSIARNLALKRYRDDHRSTQVDEEWAVEVPDRQPGQDISMAVSQAVGQLPELQREALILFEYEGFRLGEIAAIVSADVGVVKSRLHRARHNLKRLLAPYRKVGTYEHVC